jgi:hypothetical protein
VGSNLTAIVEGIQKQLQTVIGLQNVLTYRPDSPGALPMVYFDVDSWDFPEATYGEMAIGWNPDGYLVLSEDNSKEAAELARILIPQIIEAVGKDLSAHGAIVDGQVLLVEGRRGRLPIGGKEYYARQLLFRAIERFPYEYSLGDS